MHIATGMMTTPSRLRTADSMAVHLGGRGAIPRLAGSTRGRHPNHLTCLRNLFDDPRVTHAALIHDDVVAPRTWRACLDIFVGAFPSTHLIDLATPAHRRIRDDATHRGFFTATADRLPSDRAFIMSRDLWTGYSSWLLSERWSAQVNPAHLDNPAAILSAFMTSRGVSFVGVVPALFTHLGSSSTTSAARSWRGYDWNAVTAFDRALTRSAHNEPFGAFMMGLAQPRY